jgi:hypothetical protein
MRFGWEKSGEPFGLLLAGQGCGGLFQAIKRFWGMLESSDEGAGLARRLPRLFLLGAKRVKK